MKKVFNALFLISILIVFIFFIITLNEVETQVRPDYISDLTTQNGSLNAVSAIYLDYRIYDTLFEVTVFFIAAFGISYFLGSFPESKNEKYTNINEKSSFGFESSEKLIFFLTQIFAVYVILTGHLSPGGGFVGGVIGGTGMLILAGTKNIDELEKDFVSLKLHYIEVFIMISIPVFFIFSSVFFSETLNFLPAGKPGSIFSGGTALILNILIGFKVYLGTWTIFYMFVKHRGMI